jgi:hypothetical protein
MNTFGSHYRARTAPISSSSSDETPALPLHLASRLQIQPQSHSQQYLAVPTWQPNSKRGFITTIATLRLLNGSEPGRPPSRGSSWGLFRCLARRRVLWRQTRPSTLRISDQGRLGTSSIWIWIVTVVGIKKSECDPHMPFRSCSQLLSY